ncbi:MAG: DUF4445 domain-containing protein, partial [Chloroflexi bacterium]|nr:DUF4445 domain-containing protein [Chloroflexota bacterium]
MEAEVVTVPRTQSGIDGEVVPYQQDINQLQSAKGAIRAGTHVLLRQVGIEAGQVEQVIIAGAFGSYIDVLSAVCRGLLPALPLERFRQVGNAAGTGARMALVCQRLHSGPIPSLIPPAAGDLDVMSSKAYGLQGHDRSLLNREDAGLGQKIFGE